MPPDHTIFPSLLDGEFVDDSYSRAELERMERSELQQLASRHESGDVNGQMSNEDIIGFLEGEPRMEL